jgi:hypothetical protein
MGSMTALNHEQLECSPGLLVSFYRGECSDSSGHTIDKIHSWNYDKLEYTHDYIQWLFPLRVRSQFSADAPILDAPQIQAFRTDDKLKEKLAKSFKVMLSFYGLRCEEEKGVIVISKSKDYAERAQNWLSGYNHNYLRITRILTSLRLLGLEDHARAFFICLQQIFREEHDKIGDVTFGYWQRAVD